eukprot:SAG31_NODE_26538_length_440_cov_1.302053_2_plen_35_part_01
MISGYPDSCSGIGFVCASGIHIVESVLKLIVVENN